MDSPDPADGTLTSEACMSKSTPFLEARPTGFYWRRRVPAAILPRYQTPFFCFPLKTHVLREAAAVASRITAISDICFRAEIDVSPEVMTRLLVTYARLEIEASDRLRALTGPRTREAAEAGLALETAIRASLRDAIFLCERDPAFRAIENTARHLGIEISGDDEDLPILVDRMLRLMLELSEERERRARGHFSAASPTCLSRCPQDRNPSRSQRRPGPRLLSRSRCFRQSRQCPPRRRSLPPGAAQAPTRPKLKMGGPQMRAIRAQRSPPRSPRW